MKKCFISRTEVIFLISTFFFLIGIIVYLTLFTTIYPEGKWKEVMIPKGANYSQAVSILNKEGIIKNHLPLLILGRLIKIDKKLKAGYYNLNTSMTTWEIFNRLKKGMIVQYIITIPEGSMLEDIKLRLKAVNLIDDESWQLVKDKDFLNSLGIDAPSLEGYLYPDTYNFAKGISPSDIFSIMVQRLRENFDQSLQKRARELGMDENEVLTLASIIEKEAAVDSERPIISAVYHNRLKKGMRLEADPTVVYGIKKISEGITKADLRRKTPYNTYLNKGLPPAPIASAGIKSIKAALYPAKVDYIYFVSKNDGTHYFSNNSKDHEKAVAIYQRKRTSNSSAIHGLTPDGYRGPYELKTTEQNTH